MTVGDPAAVRSCVYTWPYALVFWAAFLWTFAPEWGVLFRSRRPDGRRRQDAGSVLVIVIGNSLGMWGAFLSPALFPAANLASHRLAAFWAGTALMLAGSVLRRHCFRMLGDDFQGLVTVRAGQPVVQRGAYRLVRHPSYTAAFLLFGGIGLALANRVAIALTMTCCVIVYGYRVRVEERALLTTLGPPYRDYMARTKRFLPYVF